VSANGRGDSDRAGVGRLLFADMALPSAALLVFVPLMGWLAEPAAIAVVMAWREYEIITVARGIPWH